MASTNIIGKECTLVEDVEPGRPRGAKDHMSSLFKVEPGVIYKPDAGQRPPWYQWLLDAGVEENGIKPVPVEKRTNTQYNNLFTIFFTGLLCVLP
jgi:hypothetical protein